MTDFGIARGASGSDSFATASRDSGRAIGDTKLTGDGIVMGTPAYMAPEQHTDGEVTARSDQFAFCVALFEGLYGHRPFDGETGLQLSKQKARGDLVEPGEGHDVPPRIHRAILRGLRPKPADRWPTMEDLLAILDVGRPAPTWRGPLQFGLVAATSIGVAMVLQPTDAPCGDGTAKVGAVWNDASREASRAALTAFERPRAAATWERSKAMIDAYASRWASAYATACEDARGAELDEAMRCLDGRLDALRSLLAIFAEANEEVAGRAVNATAALPDAAACLDPKSDPRAGLPEDPDAAAKVIEARRLDARVHVLDASGQYRNALPIARQTLHLATASEHAPAIADAEISIGRTLERSGDYAAAREILEVGTLRALESDHHHAATDGAIELVWVIGYRQGDLAEAKRWARHAEVSMARIEAGPLERARLHNALGAAYTIGGDPASAVEQELAALPLFDEALGPRSRDAATSMSNLGYSLMMLGRYDEARRYLDDAHAIYVDTLGPEHPDVALVLDNVASLLHRTGEFDAALAAYRRSLAIRENALGASHPDIARSLNNLGTLYEAKEEFTEAEVIYRRAATMLRQSLGPQDVLPHVAMINVGNAVERQGRFEEAIAILEAARDGMAPLLAAEHPYFAYADGGLARAQRGLGSSREALRVVERGLATCEGGGVEPSICATLRFEQARALWELPARREDARDVADLAYRELAAARPVTEREVRDADAWYAERGWVAPSR